MASRFTDYELEVLGLTRFQVSGGRMWRGRKRMISMHGNLHRDAITVKLVEYLRRQPKDAEEDRRLLERIYGLKP